MPNEKKKVVPKLRQEVKVKVDIVTSDDIKIYYTGKFQDFTARYIINIPKWERYTKWRKLPRNRPTKYIYHLFVTFEINKYLEKYTFHFCRRFYFS